MEMMGDGSVIWEGHPTWGAMLSFHIKWFLVTLVVFGPLLVARRVEIDLAYAVIAAILVLGLVGVNRPQDLRERMMHARDAAKTALRHDGQGGPA